MIDAQTLAEMFVLQGKRQVRSEPSIGVTVHCLTMSSHDRHESQLNAAHVPSPAVEDARLTLPFNIPLDSTIALVIFMKSSFRCSIFNTVTFN